MRSDDQGNCKKEDLLLYAVTDRSWLNGQTLYAQVEKALKGGVTCVQLREKNLDEAAFLEEAKEIHDLCAQYGVPFVINDNVEIAVQINADGVHVGQSDLPAKVVRKLLGKDKIIGVSAAKVEEAVQAQEDGADYLGVGAMFATGTKTNTRSVSIEDLKKICSSVQIPIVAIGGIHEDNAASLKNTGIAGLAVVSAVVAQPDVALAAARLKKIFTE